MQKCDADRSRFAMRFTLGGHLGLPKRIPRHQPSLTVGTSLKYGRPRSLSSSAGIGGICALPMRVSNPSPILDTNCAPMLSSIGAGVWRNRSGASPDSNSVLDKLLYAKKRCGCHQMGYNW